MAVSASSVAGYDYGKQSLNYEFENQKTPSSHGVWLTSHY